MMVEMKMLNDVRSCPVAYGNRTLSSDSKSRPSLNT